MRIKLVVIQFIIPTIIALAMTVFYSHAQLPQYQLTRITEQEGLRTADIVDMATDQEGYMWIATQSQVQRFDGRHTLHYQFDETVGNIYTDAANRIWVSTLRWLYFLNKDKGEFERAKFSDDDSSLMRAVFHRTGKEVYALRRNGLYLLNESSMTFQRLPDTYNIAQGPAGSFYKYKNMEYWGTADSIIQYDIISKSRRAVAVGSRYYVRPLNKNLAFVSLTSFQTRLINFETGENKPVTIRNESQNHDDDFLIYSGVPKDDTHFLFASTKGLLEYDIPTATISTPNYYYAGQPLQNLPTITQICKNASGTIYLAHSEGLFQQFAGERSIQYFRNYSKSGKFMPDNNVRNFTEDEHGNIWMATINGIAKIEWPKGAVEVFSPEHKNNPIKVPSYRQVLNDGKYIWIGSSGAGVWLLDKQTKKFIKPRMEEPLDDSASLFNTYIWKLVKLRNGQMLVIGGGRCFTIDTKTLTGKQIYFASSEKGSRSAGQDSSGRIWHGTPGGLYCMDSSFQLLYSIRDSFPDQRVAAFCEWKKDRMLIGTKGLYEVIMIGNKLVGFRKINAVPSDRFIYCMKQDNAGKVWLGTDDGIFRYDPQTETAVLFDQSDYVQTQNFNSDAAFLSSKGIMFMGGKNGVNYFDPSAVKATTYHLRPQVSMFSIHNRDSSWQSLSNPFTITYSERDIDFVISAPEYRRPFSMRFRYKLKDKQDWVYNGFNDHITVNNLSPGKYALQVSVSMDGVRWFDSRRSVKFSVAKPWWQSWWFRTLYILFIIGIIWSYSRYRKQKYKAEERKQAVSYFALSGDKHSSTSDILWDIARNCISRLGFEDCVIYLLDEERNMLVQRAAYGEKSPKDFEIANPIELPVGKGITGYVAESGNSLRIGDTTKDKRYIIDDEIRYSELAVPILHDGKVIGVIDSEHRRRHFFTLQHQQTLEQIAAICSSKIARAMAEESVRKAELQLQEFDAQMTESKFMNLRLQMNPHFLFNILTSIQYLVVSGQTAKATKYLNLFAGFLRALLHYAEATVVTLDEEIKILNMYIELETLSLDESFVYNIETDEDIETDEVLVPFMILQPFVENAIHHGLVPKVGEKKFCILIKEQDDEHLLCTIVDNGVGREKAADIKLKKMRAARHQSRGVEIVKERLELLKKKTGKVGNIHYEDLFDEEDQPSGTRVTIIIPYYSKTDLYD